MSPAPRPQISVVIPVYRSAKILPTLIEQLGEVLAQHVSTYEVILVDDASPDDTWGRIKTICASNPSVKAIGLRMNAGQHNAIIAGLNHAAGDVIVCMDDDLQHSPADVPALYAKIVEGYDVCYTIYENRRHARWKILGSQFNNLVATILLKKPLNLYLSSFKAFHREIKDEIVRYKGPFPYLDGLILATTRNIATVPIVHQPRFEDKTNFSVRKLVRLWLHMATNFSVLPLRIASLLGILFSVAGFSLTVLVVFVKLFGHDMYIPVGWTSLVMAVLIVGGVQLLAIGVIGEYLGRAYLLLNNQSQFLIRRKENFADSSAARTRDE